MIRRLLIPLLGSGLLVAGTATGVLAKCEGPNPPPQCSEVVATMSGPDGTFGTFTSGTTRSVDVSVSQGELPFDAAGVAITFTHLGDSKVLRVQAASTGQPGMWRADVTLPNSGIWTVVAAIVTKDGNAYSAPMETIQVAKAPKAPPTASTPPVSPTPPVLPIALLVAGLAAAALLATGMRERSRRRAIGATGAATATASPANSDRA